MLELVLQQAMYAIGLYSDYKENSYTVTAGNEVSKSENNENTERIVLNYLENYGSISKQKVKDLFDIPDQKASVLLCKKIGKIGEP